MADWSNTTPPSISGSRVVGGTLTADPGVWSPAPSGYTYLWERADDVSGTNREVITGATGGTYTIDPLDTSKQIRVGVYPGDLIPPGGGPTVTSDRWYSLDSTLNKQIPVGVLIHPNSANFVQGLIDVTNNNLGPTISGTPTVMYAAASTPDVTLQKNFNTCAEQLYSVPITLPNPDGAVLEETLETKAILVDANGDEWDFFKITSPGVTPLVSIASCSATANYAATAVLQRTGNGGWQGVGYGFGGTMASKMNRGAGLMRFRDLRTTTGGDWGHAITASYRMTASSSNIYGRYVAPAAGGDGTNGFSPVDGLTYPDSKCVPLGARFQLDPTLDLSLYLTGQPEWKWACARTLQRYGLIVADTNYSSFTFHCEHQNSASSRGGTNLFNGINGFSWSSYWLPNSLASHFRVIDWDTSRGGWTGV